MRIHSLTLRLGAWLAIGFGMALPGLTWAATQDTNGCFLSKSWGGSWTTTADARSIYIRLNSGQVYQLDLDGAHSILHSPDATLYQRDSADSICTPLDFRLTADDRSGGREGLIVRKMTLLTPSQVKELPKKLRP